MSECRFHQERTALWRCPDCDTHYCVECIPGGEDNFGRGEPRCPLCSTSLDYLGAGEEAEPFWRQGPALLRYGLQAGPIGVALFASFLYLVALASLGTLIFAVFGFLALVSAYLVVVSYGLEITVRVAQGYWEPPNFEQAYRANRNLSLKQIVLMLLIFAVPLVAGMMVSPVLSGLLFFLAMLALPAAIMILALSESLLDAANPVMHGRVIRAVGWPYLLLWLALSAIMAAPDLVATLLAGEGAGLLALFLVNVLSFYALLVAYALMGYLLYQYGGELGLAGQQLRGRSLPPEQYQRKAALGLSHVYARQERLDDALQTLNRALSSQPADMQLHERKHRLLKSMKKTRDLNEHGRQYCRVLVDAGNAGNATSVLKDLWQQDPDFGLNDPARALSIARVFFQQQQFRDAKRLLVNLHRDYPDFERLGEAYVLLARIYLEGYDSHDHVRRILGFVQKQRPDALESEDARMLKTMMSPTG